MKKAGIHAFIYLVGLAGVIRFAYTMLIRFTHAPAVINSIFLIVLTLSLFKNIASTIDLNDKDKPKSGDWLRGSKVNQ